MSRALERILANIAEEDRLLREKEERQGELLASLPDLPQGMRWGCRPGSLDGVSVWNSDGITQAGVVSLSASGAMLLAKIDGKFRADTQYHESLADGCEALAELLWALEEALEGVRNEG